MADVFSSQSGSIQFKSPEIPLVVDVKGVLSVSQHDETSLDSSTIITPVTDLVVAPATGTMVVRTGSNNNLITTPNSQSLTIKPTAGLVLNETRWPDANGVNGEFLILSGGELTWSNSILESDESPKLAGDLDTTYYQIFAGSQPTGSPFADNNLRLTSTGEIHLSPNTASSVSTTTITSNETISISPAIDLYLYGYKWLNGSVPAGAVGQVVTLTSLGTGGTGGVLALRDQTGISEVFEDKSPVLGGNLDTNGFEIFSQANKDITINPGSQALLVNSSSALDSQIYPNSGQSLYLRGGGNGGSLFFNAIQWPDNRGTSGQVLQLNITPTADILEWVDFANDVVNSVSAVPAGGIAVLNNNTVGDVQLSVDNTVIRTTGGQTINGALNVTGLLTVQDITVLGTTTSSNVATISTGDTAIILNADLLPGDPAQSAGFYVYRGTLADTVGLVWNNAANSWQFQTRTGVNPTTVPIDVGTLVGTPATIWTSANDGAGSGLDADLLNGQSGGFYQNANNINAGTLSAARLPAFSGDVTSAAGSTVNTLSPSGVAANTYGNSTTVPRIDVDAKGRIINASNQTIPIASTTVTGLARLATDAEAVVGTSTALATTPSGVKAVANTLQPLDATLTALAAVNTVADTMIFATAPDTFATTPLTVTGRGIAGAATPAAARTALGLGTSATFDASVSAVANTVVLRDGTGSIPGLTVSSAATAGSLNPGATINGVNFTGAAPIIIADSTKLPTAGGTMRGILATAGGVGISAVGQQADGSLSVRGTAATGAVMSFHRAGAYAINAGLDTDNVFRVGGWSDGSNVFRFWSDTAGNFQARGDVIAFSDIRLKTNIAVIPDALDKVCSLRGVTYDRIDTKVRQTGLIAQELYEVLPEAVHIGNDEEQTMSVAYGNVIGLLVESIKELRAEIEALKADK
jgi:hypothetical protein